MILSILTLNSLSIKVSPEKLEEDLTDMISAFGRCHVKIKLSQGLKKLPVGFVQFEVSTLLYIYMLCMAYTNRLNRTPKQQMLH